MARKLAKQKLDGPEESGLGSTEPAWDTSTADEIFRVHSIFVGFDIDGFDSWLASLADCGAKIELQKRRDLAFSAFRRDPNNKDSTVRHLEWILLRWAEIQRENFLLPLAQSGDKSRQGGRRGLATRSTEARNEIERLQLVANGVWAKNPRLSKQAVAKRISPDRWGYVRKVIKKVGQ